MTFVFPPPRQDPRDREITRFKDWPLFRIFGPDPSPEDRVIRNGMRRKAVAAMGGQHKAEVLPPNVQEMVDRLEQNGWGHREAVAEAKAALLTDPDESGYDGP